MTIIIIIINNNNNDMNNNNNNNSNNNNIGNKNYFLPPNSSLLNFTPFLGITTELCEDGSSLSQLFSFSFSSDGLSLFI